MPLERTQKQTKQTTRDEMIDEAIRRAREQLDARRPAAPDRPSTSPQHSPDPPAPDDGGQSDRR